MQRRSTRWTAACCAAIALLALTTHAQNPPDADAKAQIDALLKKANQQMHATTQLKDAEDTAKTALELSRKIADPARTMRSLFAVSSVYFYVGRFAEALDVSRECVELAKTIGDKQSLSVAYNGEASTLRALGRFEDAVADFDRSAAIARELGDLPMQWTIARNVGVLYLETGDVDRAEAPLKEALRLAGELAAPRWKPQVPDGGKIARAASLETLGNWEIGREHYAAAADYLEQALADKPEVPAFVAEILSNLAIARQHLGEPAKAVDLFQQAATLWATTGAPPHPIMVADLAAAQEAAGALQEARAGQERALTLVRENGGNPQYEWLIESRLAHVEHRLGQTQEALAGYQRAAQTIERLRASALGTESGRAFALAVRRGVYEDAAALLHEMSREGDAWEFAERGRARAFLDVLAESRTGLTDELTSDERTREDAILARIASVQKSQWSPNVSAADRRRYDAELTAAEQDLETFHLDARRSNPRYASVHYPAPVTLARVQTDLLDDSTSLVEFSLGEMRSLAWVVSKNRIAAIELPPRKDIETQAASYVKRLSTPVSTLTLRQSLTAIEQTGTALYRMIVRPLEPAIGGARKLIIVPDGGLTYLPFEALVTAVKRSSSGERQLSFLAEKAAIAYSPSASALMAVRAMNQETQRPSKTLLAFGDPAIALAPASALPSDAYTERGFSLTRLPYARDEVMTIGNLFPAAQRNVLLGADAREETVKSSALIEYRFIHFATHGFLDEMKPGRSGILLARGPQSAEDGILQVGEIMRLKLNADLVTLSACSTGLGKLVNGEGMLGLTRAMFYAGARNVAVSLWNVNDSATATLMASLYGNMKDGVPKAEALRRAKLSLLKSDQQLWRHPYFWAAFVIEGEGR